MLEKNVEHLRRIIADNNKRVEEINFISKSLDLAIYNNIKSIHCSPANQPLTCDEVAKVYKTRDKESITEWVHDKLKCCRINVKKEDTTITLCSSFSEIYAYWIEFRFENKPYILKVPNLRTYKEFEYCLGKYSLYSKGELVSEELVSDYYVLNVLEYLKK